MSQSVILDMKGLWTYPSDISGVPAGSLSQALNININRQGIAEPRRGYNLLAYGLPLTSDRPKKLVFWNDGLFAHYGTTFAYYDGASGFSSRASLTTPSNATSVRTVSSQNKNLYVTSSTGLKKTDAVGTSLYSAGIPKGLTIDLAVAGAGTAVTNALPYVSYRYHLARKDANGNEMFGGVSGQFILQNAAGSDQNVTATCYLPSGLDTTYFIRLYRTPGAVSAAATGDEPQLVYEAPLSSTNISNGYVAITDIVPDSLLQATLYTNPSQEGLVNDRAVPPLARDIAEYKGHMFYADVDGPQRLIFSLTSVDGTGLVAGDTITLVMGGTTEVYTGHASVFSSGSKQFVVSTAGTPAQDIDNTIKSFLKCVNLASAIVYGYSLSTGPNDFPGKVVLEARSLGTATFTGTSSRAVAFQPQLASPATVNNTSTSDAFKNGIMFSRPGLPEAVPLKNVFKVGASDDRIKRIVALRDALLIFKERDGVYVLRGENESSFVVSLLDATAKVTGPDTLVTVNSLVYGLFEAGICEVSDSGVTIISDPIKDKLLPLYGDPLTALKTYSFGIASDSDGKYLLSVPLTSSDTYCTYQIVYDTFGKTFCEWDLAVTCGGINPVDSKMYLGQGASHKIKQERKMFDYTDFADFQQTCTISAYSGATVTIDGTTDMEAGDIIYQGSTALGYIESVDSVAGTVVIDSAQTWTLATTNVTHVKAIDCRIGWNPDAGGNAAGLKQYYECALISKQTFQKDATLYFTSDSNPSESSIAIESAAGNGAFGQFVFGDEVFGGEQARSPKRIGIPRGHARCSQLVVRFENKVAYSDFQITGLSLSFNPTSTRLAR